MRTYRIRYTKVHLAHNLVDIVRYWNVEHVSLGQVLRMFDLTTYQMCLAIWAYAAERPGEVIFKGVILGELRKCRQFKKTDLNITVELLRKRKFNVKFLPLLGKNGPTRRKIAQTPA